jgi:hypothetical protein
MATAPRSQRDAVDSIRTTLDRNALPQASGTVSHVLTGQDTFVIVLLALALVAAVVLTAIWSRDKDRRKDARDVLDRIMRWHW